MAKQITKDLIADSYLRLIEGGNGDVNVTDVIRESGVSRQTFYYHFRGLEDLLEYVMARVAKELETKCVQEKDPKESIRVVVNGLASKMNLLRTIYNGSKKDLHKKVMVELIENSMRKRFVTGSELTRMMTVSEMELAVAVHAYGFMGVFLNALENDREIDVDAVTDLLYRLFSGKIPLIK